MKITVVRPRVVAEDDSISQTVEADSIEDAIIAAAYKLYGRAVRTGDVYIIRARVEVTPRPKLQLKSL